MAGQLGMSLQSKAAIGCMKMLLMVFNIIFWLSGVAVLVLGIWLKFQLYKYIELTTMYYTDGAYVLMGVGAVIVIIGSLGCLCTVKGKPALLYMFSVFLVLVFIVELTVGISGFIYRGKLEGGFETGLANAMDLYASDQVKREALDGIQQTLSCCGRDGYTDWFSRQWNENQTATNSVPPSCCIEEGCNNTELPDDAAQAATIVYTKGCYTLITGFMETNFGIIGGVAIGFAFLQLFGAIIACCLAKHINKASYEQVA